MSEIKEPSNFFFGEKLSVVDPETDYLITLEEERQARKIMLIASESICPKPVKEALASVFTNLYAEGYPHMETRGVARHDDITRVDVEDPPAHALGGGRQHLRTRQAAKRLGHHRAQTRICPDQLPRRGRRRQHYRHA